MVGFFSSCFIRNLRDRKMKTNRAEKKVYKSFFQQIILCHQYVTKTISYTGAGSLDVFGDNFVTQHHCLVICLHFGDPDLNDMYRACHSVYRSNQTSQHLPARPDDFTKITSTLVTKSVAEPESVPLPSLMVYVTGFGEALVFGTSEQRSGDPLEGAGRTGSPDERHVVLVPDQEQRCHQNVT